MRRDHIHSFHECPDCGHAWDIFASVERDDECPRCGTVSLPYWSQDADEPAPMVGDSARYSGAPQPR